MAKAIDKYGANSRFWRPPRPVTHSGGAPPANRHPKESAPPWPVPKERTFQTRAQLRRLVELEERRRCGWSGDVHGRPGFFQPPMKVLHNPKQHVDGAAAQKMRRWAKRTDDPAVAMGTLLGSRSSSWRPHQQQQQQQGGGSLWKSVSQRRVFQQSEAGSECTTGRCGGNTQRSMVSSCDSRGRPNSARSCLSFVSASSVALSMRCGEACSQCGALLDERAMGAYSNGGGGCCGACGANVLALEARHPVDVLVSRSRVGDSWARRGTHKHGKPTHLYRAGPADEWRVARGAGAGESTQPMLVGQGPGRGIGAQDLARARRARPATASSSLGASRNSRSSWGGRNGSSSAGSTARSAGSSASSAYSDVSRAASIVSLKNRESEIQAELAALSRTISAKKTMRRSARAQREADRRQRQKQEAAQRAGGAVGFLAREFGGGKVSAAKSMVKTLHRAAISAEDHRGQLNQVLEQLSRSRNY